MTNQKTQRLIKLEKEVDVYTAVQAYLDQDATGELIPEAEAGKPEFKVFVGFKKENVSLIKLSVQH